ncbi:MAG: YuzB family protein [Alicyclobacillus sp.]|nr:YuzB family protein [Alicyclobacillus sp.]
MYALIEVCDANPAAQQALYALEEVFPGLSVLETSCLSECELCARRPYVFVDGTRLDAPSVDALIELVKQHLQTLAGEDEGTV